MIETLEKDQAEFVIGSRYVPGGATDAGWSWFRNLNSRVATLLARPFCRVRDPLAGFFALPRAVLESAEALNPIGYKIGLELIVKCSCTRIVELPIHFSGSTLRPEQAQPARAGELPSSSQTAFRFQVRRVVATGTVLYRRCGRHGGRSAKLRPAASGWCCLPPSAGARDFRRQRLELHAQSAPVLFRRTPRPRSYRSVFSLAGVHRARSSGQLERGRGAEPIPPILFHARLLICHTWHCRRQPGQLRFRSLLGFHPDSEPRCRPSNRDANTAVPNMTGDRASLAL